MSAKALVIAHFKEDLSWISDVPDEWEIWIYHKSPDHLSLPKSVERSVLLPNVGREAHTYLHHIVENYDTLNKEIVFSQGNPFAHDRNFVQNLSRDAVRWYGCFCQCDLDGYQHWAGAKFLANEYCRIFDLPIPLAYRFVSGAQYRLDVRQIKRHPQVFYEALLAISLVQRDFPWNLERLWPIVWGVPVWDGQPKN